MIISDLLGNQVEVRSRKFGDAVSVEIEVLPESSNCDHLPSKIVMFLSVATAGKLARLIEDKAKQASFSIIDPP